MFTDTSKFMRDHYHSLLVILSSPLDSQLHQFEATQISHIDQIRVLVIYMNFSISYGLGSGCAEYSNLRGSAQGFLKKFST